MSAPSRPSWWEDVERIPPPPPKPESRPEPEWTTPSWASSLPERNRLQVAWVSGAWLLRCTRCGTTLRKRSRKTDDARSAWYFHISTRLHARKVLWHEYVFLGFQEDKRLVRSVAEALRAGFDRAKVAR